MKFAVAVLFLGAAQAAETFLSNTELLTAEDHMFFRYIAEYGKTYGTKAEFEFRSAQFKDTLSKITEINSKNGGFTVGLNHLADLTPAERKRLNGYKMSEKKLVQSAEPTLLDTTDLPESIDWTTKGAVNPVKNQGQCGSCWAFSTVAAIEAAWFKKTGKLENLSEQQLVDCAGGKWGNYGCNGGLMDYAFKYLKSNKLMSETDYPYKGVEGTCAYDKTKGIAFDTGFVDVVAGDIKQFQAALAQKGPLSVAIEADEFAFQFYKNGVLDSGCGKNLDHGVVAVGYGQEDGKLYAKVRNSWGASWGDQGYIKIGLSNDSCGVLDAASYPTE